MQRIYIAILVDHSFEGGMTSVLKDGSDVTLICCGVIDQCIDTADKISEEGLSAAVINMHTVMPINSETILDNAGKCRR